MKTYVTESLGPKQSYTPEGYLLCEDVPIARTGIMIYGPYELADERGELLEPGKDGVIYVTRDADALFNNRTMSSIEAKSITVHHPATVTQLVNSGNWESVTSGTAQNVRRGTGDKDNVLLADLLITKKDAIDLVRSKRLREVSLGYVANYKQTKPGLAQQTDIIGNHIALVEAGRCGALCSIGDAKMDVVLNHQKETLRRAFNTRDAALFARALDDFGDIKKDKTEKTPPDQYTDSEPGKAETPSGFENGNGGSKPPSNDDGGDSAGGTHHHVTVNLHGVSGNQAASGASTDPSDLSTGSPAEGGATQEGVDPANPDAGGGDPGAGQDPVEMIMAALKKLDMRLSALEHAAGGGQVQQQQPQQAPQKPPVQAQGGGFPPKKQPTQDQDTGAGEASDDTDDTASAGAITSDDSTEGPSGAPGPELEKNMSVEGSGSEGGGGPSPENKNAPLLRTEPGSDGDHSGQDQLPKKVTGDRMYVPDAMEAVRRREEWTDTLARAEMLMPGVRLPTFDAKLDEKQTNDTLCSFKRKTLAASFETDRGGQAIRGFVQSDSPNFTRMTCDAVDVLFAAASERMRERNNILSVDRGPAFVPEHAKGQRPQTPAEMNAFNRAFYEARDRGF